MIKLSGDKYSNVLTMYYILSFGTFFTAIVFIVVREFVDFEIYHPRFQQNAIFISAAAAVTCVFVAIKTYSTGVQRLKEQGRYAAEKFSKYVVILMKFLMWCEAGTLLSCLVYLFTGNPYNLIPGAASWLYMLTKKPTKARIFNDLELDSKEQMELN